MKRVFVYKRYKKLFTTSPFCPFLNDAEGLGWCVNSLLFTTFTIRYLPQTWSLVTEMPGRNIYLLRPFCHDLPTTRARSCLHPSLFANGL